VYPGLAVAQALVDRYTRRNGCSVPEITYVGSVGGIEERLATEAGLRFVGVSAGGIHGVGLGGGGANLLKVLRGWASAYRLGLRYRPTVLFVTGGYASVPVALAAWSLRVPILVYLPDLSPGYAVRFVSLLAKRVAVTAEESRHYFPKRKTVVTGYPVRSGFRNVSRDEARTRMGFTGDEPVVMAFGGSRGAHSINVAVLENLQSILGLARLIHITGELDWHSVCERRKLLTQDLAARYYAVSYLDGEMAQAYASADLVVCRAGASTLGELPFFGLPAVLVPYPHVWEYQLRNAEWLVEHEAAIRVDDHSLLDLLVPTLARLLGEPDLLGSMAAKMRGLARPDAAGRLASELAELSA
jgi:UDP-N-acetylglucosamine--N-acetylmuramyl-(pentapeptide) pyrophosphoryl-undecaprenol N-acetylglucosamine transferase